MLQGRKASRTMSCVPVAAGNRHLLTGGQQFSSSSFGVALGVCWGSVCFELSKVLKMHPFASNVIALHQIRINPEIKGSVNRKFLD